jgi:hypothetical protein
VSPRSFVVIVAEHPGPASDPELVKAMNIGILEQIANRHVDPCAWRCRTEPAQKFRQEPLLQLFLGQVRHGISPVICGAEAPPRQCDPPCSEKQAGIGPISRKPELRTMGPTYNAWLRWRKIESGMRI